MKRPQPADPAPDERGDRALRFSRAPADQVPAPVAPAEPEPTQDHWFRPSWPRIIIAVLAVIATVAVVIGQNNRAEQPIVPVIGLSDVDDLIAADAVQRVGLDERRQQIALWITEGGRPLAVQAARDFAEVRGKEPPKFALREFVVVAYFPLQYTDELTAVLLANELSIDATGPPSRESGWMTLGRQMAPMVVLLGFIWLLFRRSGMGGTPKLSRKRSGQVEIPATRFDDVAGVDEAVDDLRDVVEHLTNPNRYADLGARAPRGVLLAGPPGTGKTLLARAVAGEAGVAFFALSGSDFVDTFVGVGARRVRELFAEARKRERAVIFIDEIDAIGKARSTSAGGGNDETERTLNALLVEMDGFEAGAEIVVLAATNRIDLLDTALLRPGRFDRHVTIPPPDRAGRLAILEVHARSRSLGPDADLDRIARRTAGMTGAELENLLNTAAINAARSGQSTLTAAHLEDALQTLAMGRARPSALISDRDRMITAWHEAGHTLVALLTPDAQDPVSVTIVPRGPSGGTTWMQGSDQMFMTRTEALAQLAVAMGGRAAEEILLAGDFTQGAASDLQQATDLAVRMVTEYGMGGMLSSRSGLRQTSVRSEDVTRAVERLLEDALRTARGLLGEHRATFTDLIELLLDIETVDHDHLEQIHALALARRAGP